MRWKFFLSILSFLLISSLMILYLLVPYNYIEFSFKPKNSNFSISQSEEMQFYQNIRFQSPNISYKIDACPLKKTEDMKKAFEIISNLSVLNFDEVLSKEEISVFCDEKIQTEGNLFVAGEGGPSNISRAGKFNVVLNGKILLLRESECPEPNVAIHELLHVLGFKHSENKNNIMYSISSCSQTISDDIINLLEKLYSIPSYSDLEFESAEAVMRGRYLDLNMSIRNNGLKNSEISKIIISSEGKTLKEIEMTPLEIGYGRAVFLSNIYVMKFNVEEIEIFIDADFDELDKDNNRIVLKTIKE